MWGFLNEWLGDFATLPWRMAPGRSLWKCLIGLAAFTSILSGVALGRPLFATIPIAFAAFALANVGSAYRCVERAAVLDLDDPMQPPREPHRLVPFAIPTAITLFELAQAIDAVRRGKTAEASDLVRAIDTRRLRAQEVRLLEGARALVTLGRGDKMRAAQQALAALPTGCEDFDTQLGRVAIASAWHDPVRLGKIVDAWSAFGAREDGREGLPRLRCLADMRIKEGGLEPLIDERLDDDELAALAVEARAIGDEDFARELESERRVRRGYR